MLPWIQANIASIIITAVLLIIIALIVRRLVLDKKAGRHICGGSCSSCGGSCSGCPMQDKCHASRGTGTR